LHRDFPPEFLALLQSKPHEPHLEELKRGHLTLLHLQRPFPGGREAYLPENLNEHRLWQHELQYHKWLFGLARESLEKGEDLALMANLLRDWLQTCRMGAAGFQHYAWNSYALAERLKWWTALQQLLPEDRWAPFGALKDDLLSSMQQQAEYLRRHLEWDLRGNHLLRDAVGLVVAGRLFEGAEARAWMDEGTRIGLAQAEEQILYDGGHFERSPMYHVQVMEDFVLLALLADDPPARQSFARTWSRMAEFLLWVCHPDGDISLLNDSALNKAGTPAGAIAAGRWIGQTVEPEPPRGGRHFDVTGLAVWRGEPWVVFFDVGPLGPDYQLGHAHADTLTFECSFQGERFVVNPGVHSYDHDARRAYDRSTRAHNTVCIDGADSSEVWHIFRVGRRARPRGLRAEFTEAGVCASASHTGYDHLPGRPRHTRSLAVQDGGSLRIDDRIEGKGRHAIEGGLLLAPGWGAVAAPGGWVVRRDGKEVRVRVEGPEGLALREESRPYHPEYGIEIVTTRLTWAIEKELPIEVRTVLEQG